MVFTIGGYDIRENTVDRTVKAIAQAMFKFKQSLSIQSDGGWTEDFFRETQEILTAQGGRSLAGVPRLAKPPEIVPEWEKLNTTLAKHIADLNIPWEDRMRSDFDAFNRALIKVAEGVVNSVDTTIWTTMRDDGAIQSFAATTAWSESNSDPWGDLLRAKHNIGQRPYNYPTGEIHVHVRERDMRSIMKFITDKGASWPRVSEDTVSNRNGKQGRLGVFEFIVNEALDASRAVVMVPRVAATWREMVPLRTITKVDDMISILIRSGEIGVLKITDPKAICVIKNTEGSTA